eukprot:GHVP01016645.1.p1 GENE.GHVP01016645.1~~GHVP01016645.1.p1  ORF type:complete len:244 (+),score=20.95 GHVP01016645.1:146-877(+)
MIIDYRKLNLQMTDDAYPIPLLWETVQSAAGHKIYSTLDLANGFFNVPLAEEAMKYTAIVSPIGTYEYTVGIKVTPSSMQRAIEQAFTYYPYPNMIKIYIDDIIIMGDSPDEHLQALRATLQTLQDQSLFVQLKKCSIAFPEVKYLGHTISKNGVKADRSRITALIAAKSPTNKNEVRSMYGSLSYLRRLIHDFAAKTAPFSNMLKKYAQFKWTDQEEASFQSIKDDLSTATLLTTPDLNSHD